METAQAHNGKLTGQVDVTPPAEATVAPELLRIRKIMDEIFAQREEILRAFIAKYGCGPEEVEQVVANTPEGSKWFVRKRERT